MFNKHSERRRIMNNLSVKNISKTYGDFKLNGISFDIPKGYIMGFIGENGAGKTTTIKAMLNIIKRDSGQVEIFGKNIDTDELAIKSDIGFVPGDAFYPKRKVKDVTDVYKRFYPNWDETIYQNYLQTFHIDQNKKIDQLSKGMKMKYSLSLALSHHAKLLILDEPTSGLDPVARDNLLEVFQEVVSDGEISVLFSTHITSDLEKCADYITFIQEGSLIDSCSKDDLIDKYKVVNGNKEDLPSIQNRLISYKENSFGFSAMIKTVDRVQSTKLKYSKPTLDDIMIYYAYKGGK